MPYPNLRLNADPFLNPGSDFRQPTQTSLWIPTRYPNKDLNPNLFLKPVSESPSLSLMTVGAPTPYSFPTPVLLKPVSECLLEPGSLYLYICNYVHIYIYVYTCVVLSCSPISCEAETQQPSFRDNPEPCICSLLLHTYTSPVIKKINWNKMQRWWQVNKCSALQLVWKIKMSILCTKMHEMLNISDSNIIHFFKSLIGFMTFIFCMVNVLHEKHSRFLGMNPQQFSIDAQFFAGGVLQYSCMLLQTY